jgi:thiamine-phosphate pyrophosphorylase
VAVREHLRGFYAVIDRPDERLADALLAVATVLQVRIKGASRARLLEVARWARARTRAAGALLVVDDDLDVAEEVGADAVHLGQDDLPLAAARARSDLAVGVSTHDLAQVARAIAGGATYLGYGPVFATTTKPRPDPTQGLEALAAAVRAAGAVPVVAIGGVTPARAVEIARTGAAAACAISAVNGAPDPAAAARRIAAAFERPPASSGTSSCRPRSS